MSLGRIAIERAGLSEIVARRLRGDRLDASALASARGADLLALGAAADEVRRSDVGDEVLIFVGKPPTEADAFVLLSAYEVARGTELFRRIALARLMLPRRGRLCVDAAAFGLGLAQAALAFGACAWSGALAKPRGLPLLNDVVHDSADERRTLSGYITRTGRRAIFIDDRHATEATAVAAELF